MNSNCKFCNWWVFVYCMSDVNNLYIGNSYLLNKWNLDESEKVFVSWILKNCHRIPSSSNWYVPVKFVTFSHKNPYMCAILRKIPQVLFSKWSLFSKIKFVQIKNWNRFVLLPTTGIFFTILKTNIVSRTAIVLAVPWL